MKREAYIHASTRIRLLEKKLVPRPVLDRMAQAEDISAAEKIWTETSYNTALQEQKRAGKAFGRAYEGVLAAARDALYAELAELAPGDPLTCFLGLPFVYHNAKVLLRQQVLGESMEGLLIQVPGFDRAYLQSIIVNRDLNPQETRLEKAVAEAGLLLSEKQAAGQADQILDRALMEDLRKLAGEQPFLLPYLSEQLDFLNLTTLERCYLRGISRSNCLAALSPGGSLSPVFLADLYKAERSAWADLIREQCATQAPVEAYLAYVEQGDLALLERNRDRAALAFAEEWIRQTYGPEVLFAYALIKEIEIKNLRLILTSLMNGISGRAVAERIR